MNLYLLSLYVMQASLFVDQKCHRPAEEIINATITAKTRADPRVGDRRPNHHTRPRQSAQTQKKRGRLSPTPIL
jgi:hypothetical protein